MEKLVLVPFEKYQRLQEHSKMKPNHQEKMKPPPGKRDTSQKKRQAIDEDQSLLKKQTEKPKEDTSIHWISF